MAMVGRLLIFIIIPFLGQGQQPDSFKGQVSFDELSAQLEQMSHDTILINYWATWCKPCVEELPVIEQFANRHPEVKVLLVSLDFDTQMKSKLFPYIIKEGIKHDIYLLVDPDVNEWIPKVNENWSGAIPATEVHTPGEQFFHEGVFTTSEEISNFSKNGKL